VSGKASNDTPAAIELAMLVSVLVAVWKAVVVKPFWMAPLEINCTRGGCPRERAVRR